MGNGLKQFSGHSGIQSDILDSIISLYRTQEVKAIESFFKS